jgi:uncharacterized protein
MFDVNDKGIKIYHDVEGRGSHTIVFFHGMFGSSEQQILKDIRKILNKRYRTICFDYVGHGRSGGDMKFFSMRQVLADARMILRTGCRGSSYSFVGFSLGAYPSILLARDDPHVKSLFLLNPATHIPSLVFNKASNDNMSRYTDGHQKVGISSKLRMSFELLFFDLYKESEKISCPVFAFHSRDDDIVPCSQTEKLEKHIRQKKKFIYLKGENHPCEPGQIVRNKVIPEYVKFLDSLSL